MKGKNTIKAPVQMIVSICEKGDGENIEKYLCGEGITTGITFMGKGTAESDMADIFGFGLSNRDVVCAVVPIDRVDKTVKAINDITGIETDNYGLTMVMPMSGGDSTLLELLKVVL